MASLNQISRVLTFRISDTMSRKIGTGATHPLQLKQIFVGSVDKTSFKLGLEEEKLQLMQ